MTCRQCQEEIHDAAKFCDACGASVSQKGHVWQYVLLGILVAGALLAWLDPAGWEVERQQELQRLQRQSDEAERILHPPAEVTAAVLMAAYVASRRAADAEYKNKQVVVSGVIANVGKDVIGSPFVSLETGSSSRRVECRFKDEAGLAQLSVGEKITIEGTCTGFMLNVLLKDSQIL
jgi:hypothetical protein